MINEATQNTQTESEVHPTIKELFNIEVSTEWEVEYLAVRELVKLAQKSAEDLTEEDKLLLKRQMKNNPLFAMFMAGVHHVEFTVDNSSKGTQP